MINVSFILGKFYPFHDGHKKLIDFAKLYHENDEHIILVCGKPNDTIPTSVRYNAVKKYAKHAKVYILNDENMPDYPEEDEYFWDKWCNVIRETINGNNPFKTFDIAFFTSEEYGEDLAREVLNRLGFVEKTEHIPFDVTREISRISGTLLRKYTEEEWSYIDEHIQKYLQKKVYFMGAESTGKTTSAQLLANACGTTFVPEYARGYLEIKGTELTEEKFKVIINGQYAQERLDVEGAIAFYDTNLLTTYGWAKLYYPDIAIRMADTFNFYEMYTKRNTYITLMDDNIRFVPDNQRYGIDKRETNQQYWINILNEFNIPYTTFNRNEPYREFWHDEI
jgi:HTH-type transcriptional repressor of NAD biosynthesis genes